MMRLLLFFAALLSPIPALAAGARVEIVELHGGLRSGGTEYKQGDVLDGSRTIELASESRATLRLAQGLLLLKGPASFTADPDALTLESGGLLSVLKKLKKPWSVRTPAAVAAVRGTTFYVEARPSDTYLCLCEGALWVTAPGSKMAKKLAAKDHTAFEFKSEKKVLETSPANFGGHTDAEIAALKARL